MCIKDYVSLHANRRLHCSFHYHPVRLNRSDEVMCSVQKCEFEFSAEIHVLRYVYFKYIFSSKIVCVCVFGENIWQTKNRVTLSIERYVLGTEDIVKNSIFIFSQRDLWSLLQIYISNLKPYCIYCAEKQTRETTAGDESLRKWSRFEFVSPQNGYFKQKAARPKFSIRTIFFLPIQFWK